MGGTALTSLTELAIAFADLMEAEARALRRGALRTGAGLAAITLAALFAAAGLGLLLWTVFRGLSGLWGVTLAALLTGLAALAVAGVLAWIAKRIAR